MFVDIIDEEIEKVQLSAAWDSLIRFRRNPVDGSLWQLTDVMLRTG